MTAERTLLDEAHEIILDITCDCGCEPLFHKPNCVLVVRAIWLAKYDDLVRS
jgi:hypothetical protein